MNFRKRVVSGLAAGSLLAVPLVAAPVVGGSTPTTLPSPHAFSAQYKHCAESAISGKLPSNWATLSHSQQVAELGSLVQAGGSKAPQLACYASDADLISVVTKDPTKRGLDAKTAAQALVNPASPAWQPTVSSGSAANALGNAHSCANNSCNVVIGVEFQNIWFNSWNTDGGAEIVYYAGSACDLNTWDAFGTMPSGWTNQVSSHMNWYNSGCGDAWLYSGPALTNYQFDCQGVMPSYMPECFNYGKISTGFDSGFNDIEQGVVFMA